jgi:two-component system chemotaxis response regulator CheB
MINVLVVEDSRVTLEYLVYALETDPEIRVIGTASCGEQALDSLKTLRPDVILMDVHLPGIDGIETTRRIMSSNPVPVVVCTSSTYFNQVATAMQALEAGALAVLKKPSGLGNPKAETEIAAIIETLKLMSEVKMVRRWNRAKPPAELEAPSVTKPAPADVAGRDVSIVVIGASTGGPPVLSLILSSLSPDFGAPILVVQHIAVGFTEGLAEWLAMTSALPVQVAQGGETPLAGRVYIAPDDRHLCVGPRGELQTTQDEPLRGLRPSVDVLFRSVADRFGRRAIGVLLTGMGHDGAEGLKLMADRGALTVAQNQESCVVFGMPADAIALGAADFILPPQKIADLLISAVRPKPAGGR